MAVKVTVLETVMNGLSRRIEVFETGNGWVVTEDGNLDLYQTVHERNRPDKRLATFARGHWKSVELA